MIYLIYERWVALSVLVLTVISVGSLIPLAQLPLVPGSDKTHHFLAYAGLALPIALRGHRMWLYLIGAVLAWSGAIELIQPYLNRYGEWLDLVANGLGLVFGSLLGCYMRQFVNP